MAKVGCRGERVVQGQDTWLIDYSTVGTVDRATNDACRKSPVVDSLSCLSRWGLGACYRRRGKDVMSNTSGTELLDD